MKPQTHLINNLKKFFEMNKQAHTGSVNLQNASAQDYHQMIQNGNLPSFLSQNERQRITELYNSGSTFDAIRKLKGIVEAQNEKPGKSFV